MNADGAAAKMIANKRIRKGMDSASAIAEMEADVRSKFGYGKDELEVIKDDLDLTMGGTGAFTSGYPFS